METFHILEKEDQGKWSEKVMWNEALLTIIISPRHLAHTMDKRTRANGNGELSYSWFQTSQTGGHTVISPFSIPWSNICEHSDAYLLYMAKALFANIWLGLKGLIKINEAKLLA